jgi:hypothetical protein
MGSFCAGGSIFDGPARMASFVAHDGGSDLNVGMGSFVAMEFGFDDSPRMGSFVAGVVASFERIVKEREAHRGGLARTLDDAPPD